MFKRYFPSSYWLSLNVCNAVHCGAALGDIHESCRRVHELMEAGVPEADARIAEAWVAGWHSVGQRLLADAGIDESSGRMVSAGRKRLRATVHFMIAEWLAPLESPRKKELFELMRSFLKGDAATRENSEVVRIEYVRSSLEGLFVPSAGRSVRSPVVIHFNGTHSSLEWPYLSGLTQALSTRGIASLLFDHPGTGRARHSDGLPLRPDSEVPAGATIEYLSKRSDIDSTRIGTMGGSMGGYHAVRAAARDARFKACLCWGALYELPRWLIDYAYGLPQSGAPIRDPQLTASLAFMFGAPPGPRLAAALAQYSLKGVLADLRCPLYILHGANDQQVPVAQARRVLSEAVNASRRTLVEADGRLGQEHCNLDNLPGAVELLADWAAEALIG